MQTSIKLQRHYIDNTFALQAQRTKLGEQLDPNLDKTDKQKQEQLLKQLDELNQALANNAIMLAVMLEDYHKANS